jgi:hypothetical protein
MWLYHKFSKLKGWTPQQVDELTLEQAHWLLVMEDGEGMAGAQLADK